MREIKFRAWDKISGKVRIIDSIAFDKQGKIKVINVWGYNLIEQEETRIHLSNKKELERIVLTQFTGLYDKNSKEIYEGDIVVFESVFNKDKFVGRVMYYSGCKPILWDGKYSIDLAETNKEDLEVIGNIYENPELLEANNENNNN